MNDTVAILGGGMAGLAAALDLSTHGFNVTIVEETDRLGGRLADQSLGPLFGCHTATWALLDTLHIGSMLRDLRPTPLEWLQPNGSRARYAPLPLPSPLNTLISTTFFRGLSVKDRWHLLSFLERTWERHPPMPDDLELRTADQWLAGIGQSDEARHGVWNALSRFLLHADVTHVSASVFMRTLHRSFLIGPAVNTITVPRAGFWSHVLTALTKRLEALGVSLRLSTRVSGLRLTHDRVSSAVLDGGERLSMDYYVAALPFARCRGLLSENLMTNYAYFHHIGRLQPTATVTLQLHVAHAGVPSTIILLPRGSFHWATAGPATMPSDTGTAVCFTAVGETPLLSASDQTIVERGRTDLAHALPRLAEAPWTMARIIRTPDSVLAVKPGTAQYRPIQRSPFSNLFLAGDWTDTGWPPNLESAVISGERCAAAIRA